MRFWNLSYDTFLRSEAEAAAKGLTRDQYYTSPNGFHFVKKSVSEGILPMIETELLAARKRVKKLMKAEKDPLTHSVLDGKQLALKVCCNSIYGFAGSTIGPIPMVPVSASVTAIGRECIESSKHWIQDNFPKMHPEKLIGLPEGQLAAECVYGDTDSVFIKFNCCGSDTEGIAESLKFAQELDKVINNTGPTTLANGDVVHGLFDMPMYLEYEKTFCPFILLKKKKYLSVKYTFDASPEAGAVSASGIETVRRDNSLFCSETMQAFIDKLLKDKDREGALEVIRDAIRRLVTEKVDVSKLVLSKKLAKMHYKTLVPHLEVRKTIARRAPSRVPMLGDRVPFVIASGPKGSKNAMLARDPVFFTEDGEKANIAYYLEKQLKGPLERIMNPVYGRKVVLETFKLSNYVREQGCGGGALVKKHGVTSSIETRTIRPAKKSKQDLSANSRPITDFFTKS